MQIKDVDKLKAWLFGKLEPLCDADPTALSKYVVALLKKEKPKAALKELCIDQLEVFLAKETVAFVEKLFRCLESESYLKREETPPPSPAKSKLSELPKSSVQNLERRQSEDIRQKEVDDDDRDFRRSKRHGSDGDGDQSQRPTASLSSNRGDNAFAGKKRRNDDTGTSFGVKRRVVDSQSKSTDTSSTSNSSNVNISLCSASASVPNDLSVAVSTTVRRPVRERLGPRPTDDKSDSSWTGGCRHHHSHSSTNSWSSSSDNNSGSESESSTGSSVSGGKHSKKRKKGHGHSQQSKKRQRCKDYDEKGFCILGENCPYDHGVDPLVIGGGINPYPLGLPPPHGLPMPPLGKSNLLVQPLLPPVLPPRASPPPPTTSTDGYNPEDPGLSSSSSHGFIRPPIIPPHPIPLQQRFPPPSIGGISIPPPPSMMSFPPPRLTASTTLTASTNFRHQMRPRAPIHFSGRVLGKPSDTLIIRKIPREHNTITKLSSHFERFGTIVNLNVRYEGDPEGALVQFANPVEAKKAHSSTEAVFNNRFIRIYFLRKDHISAQVPLTEVTLESPASVAVSSIHGSPLCQDKRLGITGPATTRESSENHVNEVSKDVHSPQEMQLSLQPTVKAPSSPETLSVGDQSHASPSAQQRRKSAEAVRRKLELQKKTHELLQKQIQQQKLLISKLEKSGKHLSAEEKHSIMKSLKTLSSSISKIKEGTSKTVANKNSPETASLKSSSMYQQLQQKQPSTTDLKKKADALRKQAHMLGLLSSPSQPLPEVGRHDQHSDLRSKFFKQRQLLVMNVANKDQLTSYFESFGGLEGVEVDPANPNNLIFTFRNKSTANQVVSKGSLLNGKPLIMKWYTPKPGPAHPTLPTVKTSKLLSTPLLHQHSLTDIKKSDITARRVVVIEKQLSNDDQLLGPSTPTLTKLDPEELHLVEDSDEEEEEEARSWKR